MSIEMVPQLLVAKFPYLFFVEQCLCWIMQILNYWPPEIALGPNTEDESQVKTR